MNETVPASPEAIIDSLGGGLAKRELAERLAECVAKVQKTGRMGTVTLEIRVQNHGADAVDLTPTVKGKPPTEALPATTRFAGPSGHLYENLPGQADVEDFTRSAGAQSEHTPRDAETGKQYPRSAT